MEGDLLEEMVSDKGELSVGHILYNCDRQRESYKEGGLL